jgi:hypothetical protein
VFFVQNVNKSFLKKIRFFWGSPLVNVPTVLWGWDWGQRMKEQHPVMNLRFFLLELGRKNLYNSQLMRRCPQGGRNVWQGAGDYWLWDGLLDCYWYKWQTVLLHTDQKVQHFEWWVSEWVNCVLFCEFVIIFKTEMHVTWRCGTNVVENLNDSGDEDVSCKDLDFEESTDFSNSSLILKLSLWEHIIRTAWRFIGTYMLTSLRMNAYRMGSSNLSCPCASTRIPGRIYS